MQEVEGRDVPALGAGHEALDAAPCVDDEAEAHSDGAAQAVGPGLARRLPLPVSQHHAVNAHAAAVRRRHRDGDHVDAIERHLVALGLRVGVGVERVDVDRRGALHRGGHDRGLRHACGDDGVVLGAARVELPDADAPERERRQTRDDGVGHVVGVDLRVALVGDVHHIAVRPDAARAIVAGLRQLLEVLDRNAIERPAPIGGVLALRPGRHPVGEEPLTPDTPIEG